MKDLKPVDGKVIRGLKISKVKGLSVYYTFDFRSGKDDQGKYTVQIKIVYQRQASPFGSISFDRWDELDLKKSNDSSLALAELRSFHDAAYFISGMVKVESAKDLSDFGKKVNVLVNPIHSQLSLWILAMFKERLWSATDFNSKEKEVYDRVDRVFPFKKYLDFRTKEGKRALSDISVYLRSVTALMSSLVDLDECENLKQLVRDIEELPFDLINEVNLFARSLSPIQLANFNIATLLMDTSSREIFKKYLRKHSSLPGKEHLVGLYNNFNFMIARIIYFFIADKSLFKKYPELEKYYKDKISSIAFDKL